jgi:hypothetical protein
MTELMSEFKLRQLEARLRELGPWADKLEKQLDALRDAVVTGDICAHLGHEYALPDPIIRHDIRYHGLQLLRVCGRCGHEDGVWEYAHWGLPSRVKEMA